MSNSIFFTLALAIVLPLLIALTALRMANKVRLPRWMASFSGGCIAGVALFVIVPDVSVEAGMLTATSLFSGGFVLALALDRFVVPICPECGGGRRVWAMIPLWTALGLHALLDGALLELARPGSAASWALILHRIPETVATAGVLRSAERDLQAVKLQMALLQVATMLGLFSAAHLDIRLLHEGYAVAGGAILFLGIHHLHHSWKTADLRFASAVAGAAGICIVRVVSLAVQ